MFENPRRSRQARNFTTNAPKILYLKSSSEKIFSRKLPLGAPVERFVNNFYLLSLSVVPARYVDTRYTVSPGSKFPDTGSSSLIQADADG